MIVLGVANLAYGAPDWPLQAPERDSLEYRGIYGDGPEILRQKRVVRVKELGLVPHGSVYHDVIAVSETPFLETGPP